MPIYEYECQKCGHEFEREQRIVEDPIKKCPACKAQKAKRLISNTSFVLKGGGWYKDLYSSPGADKTSGDEADAKSESKSEAKKDSKGDDKSDSGKSSKGDDKSGSKDSKGPKGGKSKKKSAA